MLICLVDFFSVINLINLSNYSYSLLDDINYSSPTFNLIEFSFIYILSIVLETSLISFRILLYYLPDL